MREKPMKQRILKTVEAGFIVAALVLTAGGASSAMPQDPSQKSSDNQKNNKADVEMTAKIRKSIVKDKTLSMAAHNVKIISEGGSVTLRGEVNSEAEKAAVTAKAKAIAGDANVSDQLTVAPDSRK
jgi:osmotically-inducible protein OsmY